MERQTTSNLEREEASEGSVDILEEIKEPPLYKVLLHNDDYTTMDFVVHILIKHFAKEHAEALAIMLTVHEEGMGVCGSYTREIAESKVAKVLQEAEQNGHPLMCTFEEE